MNTHERDEMTLNEFLDRAESLVEDLKRVGKPLFLTVEGKNAFVVMSVESYGELIRPFEESHTEFMRILNKSKGNEPPREGDELPD
jgi:PHD/YefM family antitoxin component YafN of YafNO toxin-antitoxin module